MLSMKEFVRNIILFILTLQAKAILKKYQPKIIVVTGSVGKTSTKDATYAALKKCTFVRKSEKSYNSDIGVPLTILGVPNGWANLLKWMHNIIDGFLLILITTPYPRWLVIEVGADRPGDLSKSLSWLQPNIVITTLFPEMPVHVEFYSSPKAVIEEELFPVSLLLKGGVVAVNKDYEENISLPLKDGVRTITYGFDKKSDVRALRYHILVRQGVPRGISFTLSYQNTSVPVSLVGVIGTSHVYAILAGISGALAAGATLDTIHTIAEQYDAPPGRLRLVSGISQSIIIDDSYNASPVATKEALKTLLDAPAKRRIAVIGDMLELGTYSKDEHIKIGVLAYQSADIFVTVGVRAKESAEEALRQGMNQNAVYQFDRSEEAVVFLTSTLKVGKGDVVLIKGSQSTRMERVTKALMENPENAERLLPRQDPEWLLR